MALLEKVVCLRLCADAVVRDREGDGDLARSKLS
jgi:hypothetical protein